MVVTSRLHLDAWSDRLEGDLRDNGAALFATAFLELPLWRSTSLSLSGGAALTDGQRDRYTMAYNPTRTADTEPRWRAGIGLVGRVRIFD